MPFPHNPNILTFTRLSISKKSSFAGTAIRAWSVMTYGVGTIQRWRSGALVNTCEKRKIPRIAFFSDYFKNFQQGLTSSKEGDFFASFETNSVTFIGKCFLAALSSPQNNKRNGQRFIVEYSSLTFQVSEKVCKTEILKTKVISVISILL